MFLPANLHIIFISVLVAFPFYLFNRYLVKKIRPRENGRQLLFYFLTVLVTSLLYSVAAVLLMSWMKFYK